jgi:bacillithiol system protein YtxJ
MAESRLGFSPVTELKRLDELFASSSESPVVIFKHSNACPISAGAYEEMNGVSVPVHLVVVQTARQISDSIEVRTGVRHESPQVIVLKNGAPVWSASHWGITASAVQSAVEQIS